ncbi:tescalcin a isoform X3 [Ictalurus punctatus]|uniref:Calcineurin B homologous protein 3 n=1 Tax=Ictalurus punctatus TaxID=7998 RepID=A0A979EJQ2_ICTPU|nr:tescalcin a isoform X3 [Ictalurus punctatus]
MGSSHSDLREHEVQHLSETTGFSSEQIRNLHKRFKNLTHNSDTLSRGDLEKIGDLTFNPIRSQIIDAFFDKRNFRQDEVGTVEEIGFEEFLTVMSHFRPLNQELTQEDKDKIRKEKLHFLFNMHDKDNDGIITLDEYRQRVECMHQGLAFGHSNGHPDLNFLLFRSGGLDGDGLSLALTQIILLSCSITETDKR